MPEAYLPPLKLGCIADDFTGATDLANTLVRSGLRVLQTVGVPDTVLTQDVDAVVVALKSRTVASALAVQQSLAALRWLKAQGAQQFYFKYCSTFDSTERGNIGPVTEALMSALCTDFTISTPAFPDNGRTVFKGYLFVGDGLLNESGMQNHPLTPMTDPNLVRVLQAQCLRGVGLIDYRVVAQGRQAIGARIAELRAQGFGIAVVDALSNDDLLRLGPVLKDLPLVTAASGLALALAANLGIRPSARASALPPAQGLQAVLSGSCAHATRLQVQAFIDSGQPALALDPLQLAALLDAGQDPVAAILDWARALFQSGHSGPLLIYSTAAAGAVEAVQRQLGVARAGAVVEQTLAALARALVLLGVRQLLIAGGESAGACVQALGLKQLHIGQQIDPGVPWCYAVCPLSGSEPDQGVGLHLALKSGNFGTPDFFSRAFANLHA